MVALHEELKKARKGKGLTQREAAGESGISRNTIINFETGKRIPRVDDLICLAKVYGKNPADFVGINPMSPAKGQKSPAAGKEKARLARDDITVLCLTALKEAQEFCLSVDPLGVLADGIDDEERRAIQKEGEEAIEAIQSVLSALGADWGMPKEENP